jgi:hypothetical protein
MNVPVFGKTVSFANLPGIAVAVSAVVPFYKRRIDNVTYRRGFYRSFHLSFAAKNCSQIDFNHPSFSTSFMNSGVSQTFCRNTSATFGTTTFAGMCNFGVFDWCLTLIERPRSFKARRDFSIAVFAL